MKSSSMKINGNLMAFQWKLELTVKFLNQWNFIGKTNLIFDDLSSADNLSVHSNESRNTIGPSFQLDIEHLLSEFTETDQEEEASQVRFVKLTLIKYLYLYNIRLYQNCYQDSEEEKNYMDSFMKMNFFQIEKRHW